MRETLVIKAGGGEGINLDAICADVAELIKEGAWRVVLVHGGSARLNEVSAALGHPPNFLTSPSGHVSRRTDRKTLELFEMVYCGSVNKGVVERLQRLGINAAGLSGLDARLWQGTRKAAIRAVIEGRTVVVRDDYTGTVDRVNVELLDHLLATGITPVLTPPAVSMEGEAINVDADRAAAMTAAALRASTILYLTSAPGLLRNFPDESTLIPRIPRADIPRAAESAQGRMKKKVLGAEEAMNAGVRRIIFADGRIATPIRNALAGQGTVFE